MRANRIRFSAAPTRREFLASGLIGTLGLALSPWAARSWGAGTGAAKRCVVVWLNGGPSHLDTFDPKPGAPTGGPFAAIDTTVSGLKLSEHLPKLAQQAKHLAVVRSLTSNEADHERAYHFLHTGHMPQETVVHPALGSVVARHWSAEAGDLPSYVAIRGDGAGPGFFGLDFAPHVIGDPHQPFENVAPPEGISATRSARRQAALDAFNAGLARRGDKSTSADYTKLAERARRLMASDALQALDLAKTTEAERVIYGIESESADGEDERQSFARACLLARRLLERGVRFVEVVLDGWDTHENNFDEVATRCSVLDPALAGLIADLEGRGLLADTLVVCMGEFGRTPVINGDGGRDHWSDAFSAVLAGGGVRGGQVVGATDPKGEQVADRPITVPDLFATLLTAFGIDGAKSYTTPEGRPIKLVEKGTPVSGLLG